MNKSEARNCLNQIFNCIESEDINTNNSAHPALYFFHTKEELNTKIEKFLTTKVSFDIYDIYYFVNKMIKFLLISHDSHTKISMNKEYHKVFPIKFRIIKDKVYIINITKSFLKYNFSELVAINGISIEQIKNEIEEMICYSTKEFLNVKIQCFINDIGVLRSLPSIENNTNIFKYTVLKDNELKEITFNADKKYDMFNDIYIKENYSYEIIDNILIIVYNMCSNKEKMLEFIEKIRVISNENHISKFIIDLRGNIGGDSSVTQPLIDFLRKKDIVTLIDEEVFSSGRIACAGLKCIGSYFIGTGIGTTLCAFGFVPNVINIDALGFRIYKSNQYLIFDKNLNYLFLDKHNFNNYFKSIKEFDNLDKIKFEPDLYINFSLEDYINNNDPQLKEALEYLKDI